MASTLSDDTRYVKLILLLVKGGTLVVKTHVLKITNTNKIDIDACLSLNYNKIQGAVKKKILTTSQWYILFPQNSNQTDLKCWDLSLHAYILLNLFDVHLDIEEKIAIQALRNKRNELAHKGSTSMSEVEFLAEWSQLTIVLFQLTRRLTVLERGEINMIIDNISSIKDFDSATSQLKLVQSSDEFINSVITEKFQSYEKRLDDCLQRLVELETFRQNIEDRQLEITARMTVSASTQTASDSAQTLLFNATKKCSACGQIQSDDDDEVMTASNNLFCEMRAKGVDFDRVEEGSVLITFRCLSISALRNICHYITDHEYIQRLLELEMALSQCVKYPVKLTMNIVLETLYSALMKIDNDDNNKSVVLKFKCRGSEGVRNAVDFLVNGSSTNTVNRMSEALSRSVGQRVELHTTIDVDKLDRDITKLLQQINVGDQNVVHEINKLQLQASRQQSQADDGNVVKFGEISVCLIKGDIAQEKVDVIVNTTNQVLDLKVGSVSGSLLEFGCFDLQREATENYPDGIIDKVAFTSGHKLNCQMVLHIALEKWKEKESNGKNILILSERIRHCLNAAEESGYTSIAFPAIGTGHLGYPSDVVAIEMMNAFYVHANNCFVKNIHIVIHDLDVNTFRAFEREFESWKLGGAKTKTIRSMGGEITVSRSKRKSQHIVGSTVNVGQALVTVIAGDIAKQKVNIIVNLTNKDADLSLGFVSQSLLNVAGSEIQNDLLANFPWGMGDDDVAVMGGRKLTCDLLIHGCLEKWNPQNPEASKERLKKFIHRCLSFAEEYNCPKIAFPVLGTGFLMYPRTVVATEMFEAVASFPASNVKDVRFVVYQKDLNSVKAFQSELDNWCSDNKVFEKPVVPERVKSGCIGPVNVYIIRGNISDEKVDMIVNITTQSLELKGRVSSSILKAAGSGILKELEKSYPYSISEGEVAVTTGHRLKCKYVVHGYMTSWPLNPPKTSVEVLQNFISKCLHAADDKKCVSIAFPTIGIGYLGYPVNIVAMEMMRALKESKLENVKEVRFVAFPKARHVIQVFEEELAKTSDGPVKLSGCRIS